MNFQMPTVVGLTGYATVGKSTVAGILEQHGFVRFAFADGVREMALAIDPIVSSWAVLPTWDELHEANDPWDLDLKTMTAPLSEVVSEFGWTEAKKDAEVRRILQVVGTEVGRSIDPQVWVNKLAAKVYQSRAKLIVVDDVRFPNEANWIRHVAGGKVIRLHREGIEPANGHASETEIDRIDVDHHVHTGGGADPALTAAEVLSLVLPNVAHLVDV